MAQALRSTVLVFEFDGEQTVWCPMGDFFGGGVGVNPFTGWYRKVEKDGQMTCWWIMPFKESCTIRVKNLGKQPVTAVDVAIDTCPREWDDRSMHFYTTWRQQRNIPTKGGGRAAFDWNYITAKGQGMFVGDTLTLLNRDPGWWGEGDEKIYVDGEKFPSHFGTGTEDYYGYAWCTPKFFQSPFHAQPRAEGPANYGNTTNTRVRLLDGIPFNKSFQFDMEVWHWRETEVDYAATSYWYGRPGAKANHQPNPVEAQQPVKYKSPRPVPKIPGFTITDIPPGSVTRQVLTTFGRGKWEKDDHLWWTQAKPGAKLNLVVPVEKKGKYELVLKMTKAPDYAIVQLSLDGKKLGGPIDLYDAKVVPTGPVSLGTLELSKGKHTLTVEITGANPKAVKSYMFGLDRILVTPK
ncbi:MAG: glycoside hydrolase family 172 protein [Planctomycetota bacterium]|nr:glycoside hydrolase family 172 protein [Planctomycetota bacterium]